MKELLVIWQQYSLSLLIFIVIKPDVFFKYGIGDELCRIPEVLKLSYNVNRLLSVINPQCLLLTTFIYN